MDPELLADIVANPDDDAPRLVLADALTQRGDPRGEFIALDCALARGSLGQLETIAAKARRDELLAAHQTAWSSALGLEPAYVEWSRGFVHHVSRRWDDLRGEWRAFAGRTPLTGFRAYGMEPDPVRGPAELAAEPWPATITRISLYAAGITAAGAAELARSSRFGHVTALDVGLNKLRDEGVAALLATDAFAGLSTLSLFGTECSVAGARAVAHAQLPRVSTLGFKQNSIGDGGAIAIAGGRLSPQLDALDLQRNDIGDAGARALAESSQLGALRRLELELNRIGDAGARALAESSQLGALQRLLLGSNRIGAAGARALVASRGLRALVVLGLDGNELGADVVSELAAAFALPALRALWLDRNSLREIGPLAGVLAQLQHLGLSYNQLDVAAAEQLAAIPFADLRSLSLAANALGANGVRVLLASPYLRTLESLDLHQVELGDAGAVELAANPVLANLRSLNLAINKINTKGARAIANSPYLENLRELQISRNHFNNHAQQALRDRFGARAFL